MRRCWSVGFAAAMFSSATGGAQATLYNGGGNGFGQIINSWVFSTTPKAAYFTLPSASTVTGASISGYAYSVTDASFVGQPPLSDISWGIFTDVGAGVPGTQLASGTATPAVIGQEWAVALPNVALEGNTGYWLSMALTQPVSPGIGVLWKAGFETGPAGASLNGTMWAPLPAVDDIGADYGNRLTLNVYGSATTTPEPSSLALLGTGLLGLTPVLRRRDR